MSKFNELINGEQAVLVDFFATWCGPCKMMAPILQEVAGELKGAVKIIKVDIDKNPAVAQKFGIQGVPTLILFKEGKTLWRQSGVVPATQLSATIQQQLN